MNPWRRLKNLWELSDYKPNIEKEIPAGTKVITALVKKPKERAVFIPRVKEDPIKKITEEK